MAKRGSRRGKPNTARLATNKIYHGLREVDKLLGNERYIEARSALYELDQQFPENEDVLRALTNLCLDLNDEAGCQYATERLIKIAPDDREVALILADAYANNLLMTLAIRSYRRYLERWPDDERAEKIMHMIAGLERFVSETLGKFGFTEEEMDELGAVHDEAQILMESGSYPEARRLTEELIARKPGFTPARNNLSLILAMEGNLNAALAAAEETLEIDPNNFHTLGNLVSFHVRLGRIEEARQYARQLEAVVDEEKTDIWLKNAEALSYLGDDQGVIAVFNQAQNSSDPKVLQIIPEVFHYAAVAEMRLGNNKRARALWREALEISPSLEIARENLDDLSKPIAERHSPWPFSLTNWISQQELDELKTMIESADFQGGDLLLTDTVRRFIDQHPELITVFPILLERGDPVGRTLAMQLATLAKTPDMLAALHDFALSQRGPDQMRYHAAQIAREEGLLPEGPVRLWLQGKWTEVIQTLNEIHHDPLFEHRPEVVKLLIEGIEFARKEDGFRSERLFKRALELEPDSPDILNNLALSYKLQGRDDEAERIIQQISQQYPDYLLGITNMARIHIHHGEYEKAAELLKPLLSSHKRLHHNELIAVIESNIQLYLAKNEPQHVRAWLEMWENVDPDDPRLQERRQQFEIMNIPESLLRKWR
jgi:tetratricopeptide (TPR) repeat protein